MCSDLQKYGLTSESTAPDPEKRLRSRKIRYLTWDDWKRIDEEEQRLGAMHGKKREKLLSFENFLHNV
ncbi:unnamed protein product [Gongylonema pulchrum]|uniref:Uncharacterized protein n=1 Tax=Gongylonema pulchrum TaxID=637853 RepID=A0A3P6RWN2_9BILA|nr:unnamed protein product [Gongylonema pulchrum]